MRRCAACFAGARVTGHYFYTYNPLLPLLLSILLHLRLFFLCMYFCRDVRMPASVRPSVLAGILNIETELQNTAHDCVSFYDTLSSRFSIHHNQTHHHVGERTWRYTLLYTQTQQHQKVSVLQNCAKKKKKKKFCFIRLLQCFIDIRLMIHTALSLEHFKVQGSVSQQQCYSLADRL